MSNISHGNQSPQHDLEKAPHDGIAPGGDVNGGTLLGRQISVQLSPEQYERLFLQPSAPSRGDAAKRFGNPTLLGILSFLFCLTPTSFSFMVWRGADATSLTTLIGTWYFAGGLGMTLAAVGEFLLGNTFPMVVFATFGGFWLNMATLNDPVHDIVGAFHAGAAARAYNSGIASYAVIWACACFVFSIGGLRTNVAFEVIFVSLTFTFAFLAGSYYSAGVGEASYALTLLKTSGAFAFVTCISGWYLAIVLACASTEIPIYLPVGDLSGLFKKKK